MNLRSSKSRALVHRLPFPTHGLAMESIEVPNHPLTQSPSTGTAPLVPYRHTKIIATIGPATQSDLRLRSLLGAGVQIIRLNMAHGTPQWVLDTVANVRRISSEIRRDVAVMMDVKGPEIRTGDVPQPIEISVGDRVLMFTSECPDRVVERHSEDCKACVSVNYDDLPNELSIGDKVLVDSGLLRFRVIELGREFILCEALLSGELTSRRHVNLPGIQIKLPSLTDKDRLDLDAGIEAGIDFVAMSFVREASDIDTLRSYLESHGCEANIIAKIEDQSGVRNCEAIIEASDSVMVARGDLGIEIELDTLPLSQTELIEKCQAAGKPVIVATHMLESMIQSPIPTRAEISDICNAIREQADAVMLSGETTIGNYPIESVNAMTSIIDTIEPTVKAPINQSIKLEQPKVKMLRSAAVLAKELTENQTEPSGIVVFSRSGFLPRVLGALRSKGVPIYAFTDVELTYRQCLLPWGVKPFLIEFHDDPERTILDALEVLKEYHDCPSGTWVVVITNVLAGEKIVDGMQVREVP
ncbi:MAG: pyruvate kinase [Planctomycetota bacterium]